MVHVGPRVLQDGPHLDFEAVGETLPAADIVERHVAEAVNFMDFTLVHGILPVNLEEAVHRRCHLIYVVAVESDDAKADDVGDICEGSVFGALELQFAGQGSLRLHTTLDGGDDEAGLGKDGPEFGQDLLFHLFELRKMLPVFVQYGLAVWIQLVRVTRHSVLSIPILQKY